MKSSESITKLAEALLKAQRKITFALKDATNPHFKSRYADLPSVIDACKPALNEEGIVFLQFPEPSETGTVALSTRLMHESGEWIESIAVCATGKMDAQAYGSALTYLKRYSLASAVGLYQDDDDGNAATESARKGSAPAATQDMSPKARAQRITAGVNTGDASGAAAAMAGWPDDLRDSVWNLLAADTRQALNAAWPT